MEDSEIIALYLSRKEAAIERTAEKYGQRLYGLAFHIVADRQCAEECENDTYLQAWDYIPPQEPRDYFYAFLARITRHIALNCCRDRKALKRDACLLEFSREMEQCIPSPDDAACRLDELLLKQVINGFLGTLNVHKRNVFLRRYWYLDSVEEISKRFSYSESKVKTMLFRMRNQLRDYLEREGYEL